MNARSKKILLLAVVLLVFGSTQAYAAVSGALLWTQRYNGTTNQDDIPSEIKVNANNQVFVSGTSAADYVTIRYAPDGQRKWVRTFSSGSGGAVTGRAPLEVGKGGGVFMAATKYLASTTNTSDFKIVKFDPSGNLKWTRSYNNPRNSGDEVVETAIDRNDNLYVTGFSAGDYATVKYSAAGERRWARRDNSNNNADDRPVTIETDRSNNVLVTGYTAGAGTGRDIMTVKYGLAGARRWVRRFNTKDNGPDEPVSLATDADNSVYIVGHTDGSLGGELLVIKYDAAGNRKWVRRLSAPGPMGSSGNHILVAGGNIYVTGQADTSTDQEVAKLDMVLIKYNKTGQREWIRFWNGPPGEADIGAGAEVDSAGNIYMSGLSVNKDESTGFDSVTNKYSPAGELLWSRRYHGPAGYTAPAAGAVDNNDMMYLLTVSYGSSSTGFDFATLKYAP